MNIKSAVKSVVATAAVVVLTAPAVVFGQWNQGLNNAKSGGTPTGTISGIIKTTMDYLLGILGFLGIIGFVIAGILYLTAAGDEDRMKMGKNAMVWSILGVIVALLGFVIIQAVTTWLNTGSTNF